MKLIYKIIDWILLCAILLTLVSILQRMPPTFGDWMNMKNEKQAMNIMKRRPIILIETDGPIEVDGTVDVGNIPLEVYTW